MRTSKHQRRRRQRLSRLGRFIRDNDLRALEVADVTGVSRQHLSRLRYGQAEPTRPMMFWITIACRRLPRRAQTSADHGVFSDD